MNNNINNQRKSLLLIIVILGQTLLVLSSSVYLFLWVNNIQLVKIVQPEIITVFFLISSMILAVLVIVMLKQVLYLSDKEKEVEATKARLLQSRNMVDVLRAQRHDFINHLQVVYGLVQIGQSDKVKDYVNQISTDLDLSGKVVSLAKPEIAALLLNKTAQAKEKGLKFNCNVSTSLRHLNIAVIDVTRILSNLIDNAMNALGKVDTAHKELNITIFKSEKSYFFEVHNSEPVIPSEQQKIIFEKGYSTSEEEGHGFGLFIVRELVQKNGGSITLVSQQDKGTRFTVRLPVTEPFDVEKEA